MLKIKHHDQHGSPLMRSMWIHRPLALAFSFKVPTDMATTGYCPDAKWTLHNLDESYLKVIHISCSVSQRAPWATATSFSSEKDLLLTQVHNGTCHRGLLMKQAFHSSAGVARQRCLRPEVNYRYGSAFTAHPSDSSPASLQLSVKTPMACPRHIVEAGRQLKAAECMFLKPAVWDIIHTL